MDVPSEIRVEFSALLRDTNGSEALNKGLFLRGHVRGGVDLP